MVILIVVGFLVNQLAEASRRETRRFQETAAKLETAVAQVRRSERLAALGQLTAGLAHELRNPLGTMKSSAELLARSVSKENPIAQEMAGYISTEVDRTNSLITRFLDFARPQHLRLAPGDISALLDQAVASFYRERPAGARGDRDLQKLFARDSAREFRRGATGARFLESDTQRRAGECPGRRGDRQDAVARRQRSRNLP